MPFFSVIIPVYNAEATLNRCLDSILAQKFEPFEVILIDDGSKDNSQKIAMDYQSQIDNFRYIYQSNRGPSSARNRGIDESHGEYLVFLDSDDFFALDYMQKCYDVLSSREIDVLFLSYHQISTEESIIRSYLAPALVEDFYEAILSLSELDMFGYTWIKIVKRGLIGASRFREDLNLYEDEVFTCEIMEKKPRIAALNEPVYYYTFGISDSLMTRVSKDYFWKNQQVYTAWETLLHDYPDKEKVMDKKAQGLSKKSRYYALENNLCTPSYLVALSECDYFRKAKLDDQFSKLVFTRKFRRISLLEKQYKLKNIFSKILAKLKIKN